MLAENVGELKPSTQTLAGRQDEQVTRAPRAWPAQLEREKGLVSLWGRRQGKNYGSHGIYEGYGWMDTRTGKTGIFLLLLTNVTTLIISCLPYKTKAYRPKLDPSVMNLLIKHYCDSYWNGAFIQEC